MREQYVPALLGKKLIGDKRSKPAHGAPGKILVVLVVVVDDVVVVVVASAIATAVVVVEGSSAHKKKCPMCWTQKAAP